mgnify:CR=1 FL=1
MDTTKMTIKELERLYVSGDWTMEIEASCGADSRVGVQRMLRKWAREKEDRARVHTLYRYEKMALEEGYRLVAGVDEAGRGPLAGPVVAAAVILPLDFYLPQINDSKKLSVSVREKLYGEIEKNAIALGKAVIPCEVIDEKNIYQATKQGMYEAIASLEPQPDKILIDAMPLQGLATSTLSIIQGDAKSASIAAASIVAKVTRDRMMLEYDSQYPLYGFARHKGYGTKEHILALEKYGPCPIHRRSFEPVRSRLSYDVLHD